MFEDFTQENLLNLALQKGKELNVSVIEGSLCYNAAALLSVMLEDLADEAERMYTNSFPDTCDREHLIDFASRRGLTPEAAVKAVVKATANVALPLGAAVSGDDLNYTVTAYQGESDGKHTMLLECDTEGETDNNYLGSIYPVDYVEGFSEGEITEIVILGKEEESTEDFRKRYFEAVDVLPMAGNKAYYVKFAKEAMPELKYVRATYEDGYVVLRVAKESSGVPVEPNATELNKLAKVMGQGGDGYAPINHLIKTKAADVVSLNVEVTLEAEEDAVKADIEGELKKSIASYFNELNEIFDDNKTRTIRTSRIINLATDIDGVNDCSDVKFASKAGNLILGATNIIKVGDLVCNYS